MAEKEFTEVTVKEAAHEDAGRGIARVSVDVMKKLRFGNPTQNMPKRW